MRTTADVATALYDAFLAGDKDAMLALMHDDVEVRFLGMARLRGKAEADAFFDFAGGLLQDVDFSVRAILVDGDRAAGVWEERAVTATGELWTNHGVDVLHVQDGLIVSLHENNDVRLVHRHFPPYHANGAQRDDR